VQEPKRNAIPLSTFLPYSSPGICRDIRFIAESEDWLVVDKPPFLEAHPSKPNGRFTLWHALREVLAFELNAGGQISLINRLDRETSGLSLIAKTHAAARQFHLLMQSRAILKEYLAIVWGWPASDTFETRWPLLRQISRLPSKIHLKQCTHPDGAEAVTRFSVLHQWENPTSNGSKFALLRCSPLTGRTHQIRVHLALEGHPIVGDKIYGPDENLYLQFIDQGWGPELQSQLLLPRHALHSCRMSVPSLGLDWTSPLPEDLTHWIPARDRRIFLGRSENAPLINAPHP
jgi:23S rRNA pseudouridine1911/1915/1917 synthase